MMESVANDEGPTEERLSACKAMDHAVGHGIHGRDRCVVALAVTDGGEVQRGLALVIAGLGKSDKTQLFCSYALNEQCFALVEQCLEELFVLLILSPVLLNRH
jgi:hypothetical protein